ncbi:enoyl-CoA hydratase-related protein [Bacillus carboniphilus]|uniref:enoyl-CoA hydratase-related protein n=1 Tax=Bacillus carboniphilus TaxID=86663 RepID=UPI003531D685
MENTMEAVQLETKGKTAIITLNRPDSLNSINDVMMKQLVEALDKVDEGDYNLLFLKGNGKAFSSGGDIKLMLQNDSPEGFQTFMKMIGDMVVKLYDMKAITISVIHGARLQQD